MLKMFCASNLFSPLLFGLCYSIDKCFDRSLEVSLFALEGSYDRLIDGWTDRSYTFNMVKKFRDSGVFYDLSDN